MRPRNCSCITNKNTALFHVKNKTILDISKLTNLLLPSQLENFLYKIQTQKHVRQKSPCETSISSLNNHKQKTFQLMTELHCRTSQHKIRHRKWQTAQVHPWKPTVYIQKQVEEKTVCNCLRLLCPTGERDLDKIKLKLNYKSGLKLRSSSSSSSKNHQSTGSLATAQAAMRKINFKIYYYELL